MTFAADSKQKSADYNSASGNFILEADLHCHLLPDWDDGPRDLNASLEMARRAVECGVRRIVVTPHVGRSFRLAERPASDIAETTAWLQSEIQSQGIDLELVPGAEVMLSISDLANRTKNEACLSVGGGRKYVLVEAPTNVWSETADNLLFEISLGGLIPIIAHPERLIDVQKDIKIMEHAVARGAILQITARSFVGPNRPAKDCSHRLLAAGLVSLIASDAHKVEHLWPTEVALTLCNLAGETATTQILKDNPLAVLAGAPISPVLIQTKQPKKFWFW